MGKKKTEFSPVSIEEMDFQEEPSIPEVKRFQIRAPITPDKLNLPKQHPIYADRRENQQGNGNWFPPERFSPEFPQETQFHGLEACSDPSNSRGGNFENLAWKSQGGAGISSDLSMDSFRSLIALADAAATSTRSAANGIRQGNSNPFITIFNTPFEGDRTDSNFTASPLANQDFSFAPNLWNKSSCAPNTYLCECFKTLPLIIKLRPLGCEKNEEHRKGCDISFSRSQGTVGVERHRRKKYTTNKLDISDI